MLFFALMAPALAASPGDVILTNFAAYEDNTAAYHDLVRELGVAIANKPMAPGETLGLNGFDLSVFNSVSFLHARGTESDPSGWERTHTDGEPSDVLWIPTLGVRKGLPLSLEAGMNVGWIGMTHQGVLGGFGRWALIEGYRQELQGFRRSALQSPRPVLPFVDWHRPQAVGDPALDLVGGQPHLKVLGRAVPSLDRLLDARQ